MNDALGRIEALEQENRLLKAHQKETDERLAQLERETEPMRLERRLSIPEANTLQAIQDTVGKMAPDVAVLKGDVAQVKVDVSALKFDTSLLKRIAEEHGKMLEEILRRLPEKE